MGRTDYYLLNDPNLSFHEVLKKKVNAAEAQESKEAIKLESHEDILKFDKDEILVKLEKGEGTLKIEKVAVKKEEKEKKAEDEKAQLTVVKTEKSEDKPEETEQVEEKEVEKEKEAEKESDKEVEKMEVDEEVKPEEKKVEQETEESEPEKVEPKEDKEPEKEVTEEEKKPEEEEVTKVEEDKTSEEVEAVKDKEKEEEKEKEQDQAESDVKETEEKPKTEEAAAEPEEKVAEKEIETPKEEVKEEKVEKPAPVVKSEDIKAAEAEADLCSKQAAELKAMFPDLEVIQPLSRLSQVDTFVLRDKQGSGALDFSETTVAQLFNNAVKWPKEYAIQVRLQHIIYAIDTKEWPATKSFSAYASGIGSEIDIPIHELPNDPPKRETSTPMSRDDPDVMSLSRMSKKSKRHIAIDVETERAKLHALLNSSHMTGNPMSKHGMGWGENDDSEDSRRSTPNQGNLQPPPAHQHATSARMLNMPYDIKYHSSQPKTIGQTTVIPGTSSTLTPIDLSSR